MQTTKGWEDFEGKERVIGFSVFEFEVPAYETSTGDIRQTWG